MTKVCKAPTLPLTPALPQRRVPRQLSMAFESAVTLDLTSSDRTQVVTQLSTLLLEAAGVAAGGDDGPH